MDVSIDRNPDVQLTLAVPQPDPKRLNPAKDVNLVLEKPLSKINPPRGMKPPQLPQPPKRIPPPPQQSAPQNTDFFETLEDFANPTKLRPTPERVPPPRPREEDPDDESELGSHDSPGFNGSDVGDDASGYSVDEPPEPEEEPDYLRPSPGFATIDEEKASLIFKLARAKRAGMPSSRTFTMTSDIRDMRGEMARIDHELALDGSLKFQRKMLMMTVSVMEHLNSRYDPFELQLSGWSESVHSSISDYDRVFERLHEKYKSKVSVAPEIELLFMVAGSAMMFHFTKTVFKQGLPGMSANPELMQSMMKAFAQAQAPANKPPQQAPQQATQDSQAPQQGLQRREMRGPQMDLGGILGGLTGGGAMPFPPMGPPQIANAAAKPAKSVSFAPGTKRPAANDLEEHEEEERLSDVVSELESVPDDLTSIATESTEDGAMRTVQVKAGKGRAKKSKTVITL